MHLSDRFEAKYLEAMTPALADASPAAAAPGARKALILLLLINLMNYVDRQILAAVEKPISKEFGVSASQMGLLVTAFLFAYIIFSPVFGFMADRTRRWVIIGVGVVLWSLASAGSGAVSSYAMLFAMRLFIGIGEAAYGPVAPTLIADLYPVADRGKKLAWFYAAIPVGSALGYVVGGLFHAHWHWAFYVTLPPGLILGAICFMMPEPARGAASATPHRATREDYLSLLRNRSFVICCAGMTAMTFAMGGIAFFMPRYLEEVAHLKPDQSTPIFGAILVVAGLLATLAGGWAGDRLRSKVRGSYFLVSAAGLIAGFPLLLLVLVTPFPLCWVVIFLAIFALFFNTGPANAILANVTAPHIRATAFAVNILIIHLFGDAISPTLIGLIRDATNMKVAFAAVGVMMLLGGVVWLFGAKYLEGDMAKVSNQ